MYGARGVLIKDATKIKRRQRAKTFIPGAKRNQFKRVTQKEQAFVESFIASQPAEVTKEQIDTLANLLQRKQLTIKNMIDRAREKFAESAERYVATHLEATEKALRMGDTEQALKGSQWAITNLSLEGHRIIDAPKTENEGGSKVLIGVHIGGLRSKDEAIVEEIKK